MNFFKAIFLLTLFSNKICISQTKDSVFIKILIDSALKIEFTDNPTANQIAQKALLLSKSNNLFRFQSKALTILGYLNDDIGKFKEAKSFYEQSLAINKTINNQKGIALDFSNLGLNAENAGDLLAALEFHNKALEIRSLIKDSSGIAATNNNIGNIYGRQGEYNKALNYFLTSLRYIERMGNENNIPPQLNNVAVVYFRLNKPEKAIEYYTKAMQIWKKNNNKEGVAIACYNVTNVYKQIKEYEKALQYANEALKLYKEVKSISGEAETYNSMGSVYHAVHNYEKALVYIEKALKIKTAINDNSELSTIYSNLATSHQKLNHPDKALLYLDKALTLAKSNHILNDMKDIYFQYYEIYKLQNKTDSSLKYHELYFAINDTIYNIETTKQLNELNTHYETDKKERENHVLQIENELSNKTIKEQKLQAYIIIGGLILTLLIAIYIYVSLKKQRGANKLISLQKTEVENKNKIIEQQKHIVEEKQKEILDSINYAKRIQYTLLAHSDFLKENIPNHFVYFNPKDIVSGDFYWATKRGNKFYLAVCDSTGHGVPGAFMSLLNIGFLSEAINEKGIEKPNEVFNFVRKRLIDNISKEGQKDGFDGILICFDKSNNTITYSAANNAPILIAYTSTGSASAQMIELESDRMPVGMGERKEDFKLYTINIKQGDTLYLYTDGYADQFGGPKGKKFKYKQLNELLLSFNHKAPPEQKEILQHSFEKWKGNLEQVDDVCIIGITI